MLNVYVLFLVHIVKDSKDLWIIFRIVQATAVDKCDECIFALDFFFDTSAGILPVQKGIIPFIGIASWPRISAKKYPFRLPRQGNAIFTTWITFRKT